MTPIMKDKRENITHTHFPGRTSSFRAITNEFSTFFAFSVIFGGPTLELKKMTKLTEFQNNY